MVKLFRLALPIVGLVCLSVSVIAQEAPTFSTDRPDQTESASVVPQGSIQLEFGAVKQWNSELGATRFDEFFTGGLVRIGLLEDIVEVRLQQYYGFEKEITNTNRYQSNNLSDPLLNPDDLFIEKSNGWSALNAGAKFKVLSGDGWKPQIALLYDINLLEGSSKLNQTQFLHNVRLLVAHQFKEWNIGYNVGRNFGEDLFDKNYSYTLSLSHSVTHELGVFLEGYGDVPFQDIHPLLKEQAIDAGFTYLVSPRFQLDLYGGRGLTDRSFKWMLGGGFSVRFLK
jgi:hypothetical protein